MPFIIWVILEILIFSNFSERFGFGDTFMAYLLPSVVGFILLNQFKSRGLGFLQGQWQEGVNPSPQLLNATARIAGAVLLIPPTFTTRLLGILLLIPGPRHLVIFLLKTFFLKRLVVSGSQFFKSGPQGFSFYSNLGGFGNGRSGPEPERDVTSSKSEFIDVQPIQVEHKDAPKKD